MVIYSINLIIYQINAKFNLATLYKIQTMLYGQLFHSNFYLMILSCLRLVAVIQMTLYILMATYSCTYAYRKLTRPGTSSEIKFVFVRKHIFYVLTFSGIWSLYLCFTYFNLRYSTIDVVKCASILASGSQ